MFVTTLVVLVIVMKIVDHRRSGVRRHPAAVFLLLDLWHRVEGRQLRLRLPLQDRQESQFFGDGCGRPALLPHPGMCAWVCCEDCCLFITFFLMGGVTSRYWVTSRCMFVLDRNFLTDPSLGSRSWCRVLTGPIHSENLRYVTSCWCGE